MPPQNEERFLHVERPAAVRHHDPQVREIDRHVVQLHRIAVLGARTRKNRGPGVHHHGQPARLAALVDLPQGLEPIGVGIRGVALVRRMDLAQANPQIHEPIDVAGGVLGVPGVDAAVGQQALGVGLGVLGGEGVGRVREPHHVGAGIVHHPDAPHARLVEDLQQRLGVVHDGLEKLPVRFLPAAHGFLDLGFEVAPRLDVDVDVGDARQSLQV